MAMRLPEPADVQFVPQLPEFHQQRSVAFEKAVIDLPRGTTYIAYPYWRWSFDHVSIGLFEACNATSKHRMGNSTADWAMGEKKFGGWQEESAEFVNTPLKNLGYDVVDAFSTTFKRSREKRRAELLISARITEIKSNQCHLFNVFLFKDEDLVAGDAYVRVEWEVYDTLSEKVIATFITEGTGIVEKPTEKGNELLLLRALSDAADRLGHEENFYKLITQENVLDELIENEENQKTLYLELLQKQETRALNEHYNTVKKAIVTVGDEGSGFYITGQGHILTTAETVGVTRTVVVEDSQGTRYQAKVLRTNTRLNVALLQAIVRKTYGLPIAPEEMQRPLTQVYTIGNPNDFKASSTVSQGIVSNWRFKKKKRENFIQVSISTTSGYAGAPLLDEYGNVLGLHDGRNSDETNFSYFIPIHDALRALKIQPQKTN